MLMTSTSFDGLPSAFSARTWLKPHRTSASLELPASSKILTGTRRASGATPTTPTPFSGAKAVPETCVPCPYPSSGGSAGLTQFLPQAVVDGTDQVGVVDIDAGVEDGDPRAVAAESLVVGAVGRRIVVERPDALDAVRERLDQVHRPIRRHRGDVRIASQRLGGCGGPAELESVHREREDETNTPAGRTGQAGSLSRRAGPRAELDDPRVGDDVGCGHGGARGRGAADHGRLRGRQGGEPAAHQ